ncbi:MAG: YfhO family protein [Candidatus Obscuribacterales bacterium]|nr:YfhO family protein [Candidatus Obscuribacterales bacterium]
MWNPYSYCGMPQLAITCPCMFYPPNLLYVALPFSKALAWLQIAHHVLFGFGAFALSRTLGSGRRASLLAGFAMGMCGYNFATAFNCTLIDTVAWLPLALNSFFKLELATKQSWRQQFICAAALYGMILLAGRPEIWMPGSALIVFCIFASQLRRQRLDREAAQKDDRSESNDGDISGANRRLNFAKLIFARGFFAMVIGIMIAMPTFLPTTEWLMYSPRSLGLDATNVLQWSAGWYDWLCMLLCEPLGDMGTSGSAFLPLIAGKPGAIQYIYSLFVGPAIITLALWGLVASTKRTAFVLPALMLVGILVASGGNIPGASFVVDHVSFLRVLRYPVKLGIFVDIALCILAARGMHFALKQPTQPIAQITAALFWILIAVVVFLIWLFPDLFFKINERTTVETIQIATSNICSQSAVAIAIGLMLVQLRRMFAVQKITRSAFEKSVMILVFLPLFYAAFSIQRTGGNPDFYRTQGLALKIQQHRLNTEKSPRLFTIDLGEWHPSKLFIDSDNSTLTEQNLQYDRQICHPNTHIDANLRQTFGYEGSSTAAIQDLVHSAILEDTKARQSKNPALYPDLPIYRICRLTAAGSVMSRSYTSDDFGNKLADFPTLSDEFFDLVSDDLKLNVKLYRVRNPLARAYFPEKWSFEPADEIKKKILDVEHPDIDPEKHSYINESSVASDDALSRSATETDNSQVVAVESIVWTSDEPEYSKLTVKTSKRRLLVVSDSFYPGWYAKIDGSPVDLLRVNQINRGVFVPQGNHTVEINYSPMSLKIGIGLFVLSISILIGLAVSQRRK